MTTSPFARAIVIVLDSVGVGELPDAADYGDRGSNTLGNIARHVRLQIPALSALGLLRQCPTTNILWIGIPPAWRSAATGKFQ